MSVDNERERVARLVGVDDNVGRGVDGEEDVVHLGVDKVIFKISCILIFFFLLVSFRKIFTLTKIITQAGCSSSLPYCTIYILFVHFRDHLVIIYCHFHDHRILYNNVRL